MNSELHCAKFGEHLLSCPVCSPVHDRYCDTAIELLRLLYHDDEELTEGEIPFSEYS
jgi:hypothetical protein